MSGLRRIVGNTVISMVGQMITWTSTLLLTAAYGRYLGAEKFGELYFAITFSALVGFPLEFSFNQQIVRDVAQAPEKARRYLTASIVLKSGLWIVLYAVILGIAQLLGYSSEQRVLIAICGILLLSGAISNAMAAVHNASSRAGLASIGLVIEKGLGAVVAIVLLRLGFRVEVMAIVLLVGSVAGMLWQAAWLFRFLGLHLEFDADTLWSLVRGAMPFLAYGILGVIYYRIDTVLLSLLSTTTAVGLYGAGYRLFDTLVFIPNVIMAAIMAPVISRLSVNATSQIRVAVEKSATVMILCVLPIATGMTVAAPNIIGFLYHRSDFSQSVPVLQALAPGLVALYLNSVLATVLVSTGNERKMPFMAGAALVFNLAANLLLIPRYQQVGAAIATSLTEVLLLGIGLLLVRRDLIPVRVWPVAAKGLAACLAMALVIRLISIQSILVIAPVAAVVYLVTATLLRTLPREDVEALAQAVVRRSRRGGTQAVATAEVAEVAAAEEGVELPGPAEVLVREQTLTHPEPAGEWSVRSARARLGHLVRVLPLRPLVMRVALAALPDATPPAAESEMRSSAASETDMVPSQGTGRG